LLSAGCCWQQQLTGGAAAVAAVVGCGGLQLRLAAAYAEGCLYMSVLCL